MIDLLVAGGGPAGLATALHAARAGLDVVVVERRSGAIDKACGEGLMPHTVRQLERLGVQPQGREFSGITYVDGDRRASAEFRSGAGRGVRRIALHAALLEAATAAGVKVVQGDVGKVTQDGTSVRVGELRARYLAAADGLHSPIRRSLGLAVPCDGPRRWGIRRHVQIALYGWPGGGDDRLIQGRQQHPEEHAHQGEHLLLVRELRRGGGVGRRRGILGRHGADEYRG